MPFKNSDRSVLEQACERLATMAYEVLTGKMAYGLKSVEYSYGRGKYARATWLSRPSSRRSMTKTRTW